MGQLSFLLPETLSEDARRCLGHAARAGGYDQSPVPSWNTVDEEILALTRDVDESGYLILPWPVAGYGSPTILSSTLRERAEPYSLLVELARGKLNQVRTQTAEWEQAGLAIAPADRAALKELIRKFGRAVLAPTDPGVPAIVEEVLTGAHRMGDKFTWDFSELLMRHRLADQGKAETRFGARVYHELSPAEQTAYTQAFNAVRIVPNWNQIEPQETKLNWSEFDALIDWSIAAGLKVTVGPLIDLAHGPFPEWLKQWDGDMPSLSAFMCDFVETLMNRYRDRVSVWQVFAGFNHTDSLGLGEDDRLRLAARLLEAARQAAPAAHLIAGLSVVWGDYLTGDDQTYSPLVFADTLLRGGLHVGGLELELLFGEGSRASRPRTVIDTYRVLDLFALLGIPLELSLATPTKPDPLPVPYTCSGNWVEGTAFLALSVTQVHGVYWDCWSSVDPARIPDAALWQSGTPAPQLTTFTNLRKKWVK